MKKITLASIITLCVGLGLLITAGIFAGIANMGSFDSADLELSLFVLGTLATVIAIIGLLAVVVVSMIKGENAKKTTLFSLITLGVSVAVIVLNAIFWAIP